MGALARLRMQVPQVGGRLIPVDRLDQVQALLAAASSAPPDVRAVYLATARTKLVEAETRLRQLRASLEEREAEHARPTGDHA